MQPAAFAAARQSAIGTQEPSQCRPVKSAYRGTADVTLGHLAILIRSFSPKAVLDVVVNLRRNKRLPEESVFPVLEVAQDVASRGRTAALDQLPTGELGEMRNKIRSKWTLGVFRAGGFPSGWHCISVQSDRTAKRSFYGIVPLLKFKLIAVEVEDEQTNG